MVVITRHPSNGPVDELIATDIRPMPLFEWWAYRLRKFFCKTEALKKPPTGFPSISIGVWISADQHNRLLCKDEDAISLPSRYIARELVLMPPEELTPVAYDEGYNV